MTVWRGYSQDRTELTPRMRDVLASAARGATAAATARELNVSESTVKAVRAAAIGRLDVPNLVAAVARATARGELPKEAER